MNIIRVNLGNGDWADMFLYLKHGTSVEVQALYRPYLSEPGVMATLSRMEATCTEIELLGKVHEFLKDSPVILEAADLMIVKQVSAWSFGPVDKVTLYNEVPEDKRNLIAAKGNELYAIPLAGGGDGKLPVNFFVRFCNRVKSSVRRK
ncbi:MAG: hypothetical protein Q8M94_12190 [Ignavibacteria bacterium]|nr:hypothetical protein [Ignavibacteria bacterium]